ncbi:phospholipase effector Tle1 domain-containing protein [Erwinia rhapontici]|uniref:phospholipase effector Tle1 domain-containing protein n=2 Tax=Erwinia rhapontici TaxID=55212 RepID=UPI003BA27D9D
MAKGYFLRVGDKTSCGGEILSGHSTVFLRGAELPREGSLVSCGKNPGMTYSIISGPGKIRVGGMPLAGTLDSVSSCPCGATFISSIPDGYGKEPACVRQRKPEPIELSLFAPSQADEPQQHAQSAKKKRREITLTIGVFFDGTGNNADNSADRQNACAGEHYGMSDGDAESTLSQCVRLKRSHSGIAAGSYLGYYTNVYWLNRLYTTSFPNEDKQGQIKIYIEGIGTESGKGDSAYGVGTGRGNTGVVRKTDKAVAALVAAIKNHLDKPSEYGISIVRELQFDIFGFSRGAAAARHFANRVFDQDDAIIAAVKAGVGEVKLTGKPGGKTRFLGIFDTVAGIGTPLNGFNPHSADTGEVNIVLRPGVAEKVFHITAQHECRFNFALNSVKPAWPELALPGAHSDIGGGYNPDEYEACFLTRPQFETVQACVSDKETATYRHARAQLGIMTRYPAIAPLLEGNVIKLRAWHDDRMPADRYGMLQKRSGAALILERPTRNDWSKVALRVMIDAAQDAGVVFEPIRSTNTELKLPSELYEFYKKAIVMGRTVRNGQRAIGFTTTEITALAGKYLHCSANWNSVIRDSQGRITGAVKSAKLVTFTNRPDERWLRTIYDMDGNRIWK